MATFCNEAASFSAEAGEDITAGYLVSLHDADGKLYHANASSGASQDAPAVGVAETAEDSGTVIEIKRLGKVCEETGLKEGEWCYLATVDGQITQTAPSAAGEISQVVGIAVSTTEWMMDFHPDTTVS